MARPLDYDCVVVGAGAAGIGAARTLAAAGRSVVLLEALPRIGGRAYCETVAGNPFDWGCHWLHSASLNPLRALADQLGFRYLRTHAGRRIKGTHGWCDDASMDRREAAYEEMEEAIAAYAGPDCAVAELMPSEAPLAPWATFWLALTCSFDPADLSIQDYVRYVDTDEDWPVLDGYGALVARLADGLDIRTGAQVTDVIRRPHDVRLRGDFGTLSAACTIVTASTSALAAGLVRFEPALPSAQASALAGIPLGSANKYVFEIAGDPQAFPDSVHLLDDAYLPDACGIYSRPYSRPMVVAHTGGSFAASLEAMGERAALDAVREQLKSLLGAEALGHLGEGRASAWGQVASIRGAYSAALVGHGEARPKLVEAFDERVALAGEACHLTFYSTAHGAYESGIGAAETLLAGVLAPRWSNIC